MDTEAKPERPPIVSYSVAGPFPFLLASCLKGTLWDKAHDEKGGHRLPCCRECIHAYDDPISGVTFCDENLTGEEFDIPCPETYLCFRFKQRQENLPMAKRNRKHDAILEEYFAHEGFPLNDRSIANICGIPSKSTVQSYRKAKGIPAVNSRRSISDARLRAELETSAMRIRRPTFLDLCDNEGFLGLAMIAIGAIAAIVMAATWALWAK